MKTFFISVVVILFACRTTEKLKFINYEYNKKQRIILRIPKGGVREESVAGGAEGSMITYRYPDSSVIYISNAQGMGTPNNQILRDRQVGIYDLLPDTTFSGKAADRFYMDVKYKNVSYGYSLVPEARKAEFDAVMRMVKIK